MSNKKLFPHFLFAILIFTSFPALGFQAWWQCSSRQGGDWSFGRAPSICLVDHMQTQTSVKNQYAPLLFNDTRSRTGERNRYMTELNALAKEVARYYLKKRKPSVSENEIQAFTKGLLTLMHQETVWSHYRSTSDQRVRYMRGDNGHGHGLMQVDDRSHQTALLQGRGADLIKNMIYGLDVFYAAWQRAPSQSCVNGPTDYTARIRSAWSAYNGGPARICRWTRTTGTFAHHDKQFLDKLRNQSFKRHVTSENKKTVLDVNCLAEGSRPCANSGTGSQEPARPIIGELYQVGSGMYCLNQQTSLECVDRLNDVNCLSLRDNKSYRSQGKLSDQQVAGKTIRRIDRNRLCQSVVTDLYEISQNIETKKRINIRKTPAGELLGTLALDTQTPILDFEVTDSSDQKRYYKVRAGGFEGYIYAGDRRDAAEWSIEVDDGSEPNPIVANIGDSIEIVAPFGINQRQTPAGRFMQWIPKDEVVEVIDRVVQGSQNYLYYKVSYKNQEGYIYSGYLKDMRSVEMWTRRAEAPVAQSLALKPSVNFRFLKECPEEQCEMTKDFIRSNSSTDQVVVNRKKGEWSEVSTLDQSKKGWVLSRDLEATN